jgi:hypothetical protein
MLVESLLQRMQAAVGLRHAFDGKDLAAFSLYRKDGAGLDGLAVEIDGAGTAMGGVAADMRTGQAQMLAQEVDQQRARFDLCGDLAAIDGHRHPHFVGFGCHRFGLLID